MQYLKSACEFSSTEAYSVLLSRADLEILTEIAQENGLKVENGNGDLSLLLRAIARNFFQVKYAPVQLIDGVTYYLRYDQWRQYVRNGRPNDPTELVTLEDFLNAQPRSLDL